MISGSPMDVIKSAQKFGGTGGLTHGIPIARRVAVARRSQKITTAFDLD